jgi:hypothetical protein
MVIFATRLAFRKNWCKKGKVFDKCQIKKLPNFSKSFDVTDTVTVTVPLVVNSLL